MKLRFGWKAAIAASSAGRPARRALDRGSVRSKSIASFRTWPFGRNSEVVGEREQFLEDRSQFARNGARFFVAGFAVLTSVRVVERGAEVDEGRVALAEHRGSRSATGRRRRSDWRSIRRPRWVSDRVGELSPRPATAVVSLLELAMNRASSASSRLSSPTKALVRLSACRSTCRRRCRLAWPA